MGNKKRVAVPDKHNVISLHMDATFFFERAVSCLDRLRYDKAIKYFRRALDYEPENPVNHCNLAGILSEVGNYQESNQILQKIVDEVDPTMTECYFYMANNFANMDDFESAEKAIVQYLEKDPDGHFLQESEEMIEMLSYELEREPQIRCIKSREALFDHDKARSLLEEGRFAEAVRILKRLSRKFPDFTAARNNLALAYYYTGQFEKAMETVKDVLSREPGNLHAMCNLAIFYQHFGERSKLARIVAALCKTYPIHQEHVFKLATTMGIVGEHDAAYRLFRRLAKIGGTREDPCFPHYLAVAAYNTGRLAEAEKYWRRAAKLDACSNVPAFYLNQLYIRMARPEGTYPPLNYHYHLPLDEQIRALGLQGESFTETIRQDPVIRSSFFWALRHGDTATKIQVLQAFLLLADNEVQETLKELLLETGESDYVKRVALFVLRSIGVKEKLEAVFGGQAVIVPASPYAPALPEWSAQWQSVLDTAFRTMGNRYELTQRHDLETLWVEYISRRYPSVPRIIKPEGWAAALEYLTAKMHRRPVSYEDAAARYGVSSATVRKHAHHIDETCGLNEKMSAIFHGLDT